MPTWREIGLVADLKESTIDARKIEGKDLVLVRVGESVYCFADRCSHQDLPLSEFGAVRSGQLLCHAHGARFRLHDGTVLGGPTSCPLACYPVRVVEGRLFVDVADDK